MHDIATAQADIRLAYRSASVGQVYAGLLWLASGATWLLVSEELGIWVLLVGGFFIYPVTALVSRLLGNPGSVEANNPLKEASVTIPIVGALGIPVAGAAGLYDINWFFPALMVIMGAHYLPFSHLYGMRVFVPLGAGMWLVGFLIGLWFRDLSAAGALLTGVALLLVGLRASSQYSAEFVSSPAPD